MLNRRNVLSAILCAAASKAVAAEKYPTRPIRVIVPFTAGGGTDIVARTIMPKIGDALGGTIVIENRGGAGGVVGTATVASAAPDGYTLGLVSAGHAVNPSLYKGLPYDSIGGFQPVSLLCSGPGVLVVNPSLPVNSIKELIDYIKAQPKPMAFASAGMGTPPHLAGELFLVMAGVKLTHVPYRGNDQVMLDVISNRVPISFPTIPSALPFIQANKLRALAVTSAVRATSLPDVPTIAEAGLAGYEASSWYGLLAPVKTPSSIVAALHTAVSKAMQTPALRERLLSEGLEPVGSTPEAFASALKVDTAKWADLAKRADISPNPN
ncbi:MAG TPA: tripartite tricarboxylate transporter substrate binding protein [Pseudolabrys sp.]|jgi:tripartite-type tricarboxylate transporter receptor subunit TctC